MCRLRHRDAEQAICEPTEALMSKLKRFKNMENSAASLGLPASRGLEAEVKAALTKALIQESGLKLGMWTGSSNGQN